MKPTQYINEAIASLCSDICAHYDADDNKKRTEAIAYLALCQRLLPDPEPEENEAVEE